VAIVPMSHGAKRTALIGDDRQLPPTVKSNEAAIAGAGYSLFERLLAQGFLVTTLDVQFRMHPSLSAYPFSRIEVLP